MRPHHGFQVPIHEVYSAIHYLLIIAYSFYFSSFMLSQLNLRTRSLEQDPAKETLCPLCLKMLMRFCKIPALLSLQMPNQKRATSASNTFFSSTCRHQGQYRSLLWFASIFPVRSLSFRVFLDVISTLSLVPLPTKK